MVGPERDWKLWNSYESGEVLHEFFEWYGWFEFGQRRTGDPGRQGGGEMECSPAWRPFPRPSCPRHGEGRRLGATPRRHLGEPLAGGAFGDGPGRAGGAPLLETPPRHPLRNGVHSALPGEGGG